MYPPITASLLRIYNVSSTTSAKTLRELLNAALGGKSGDAAVLPPGDPYMIYLTPSASVVVSDAITGDGCAVTARTQYPCEHALDNIKVLNTATVTLELYYGMQASNK